MAALDFIPHAFLTCMLRLSAERISKKPGGIFDPFQHLLVPVQMEISRAPPQRSVQEARCLNLNFLGGDSFFVKNRQAHPPLCSHRQAVRLTRLLCFLVGNLDSSVLPRAHKHLQKRRQSRSNPRAWLLATSLGGQFSTGSDLCNVSLHFSFHLYRDFQESTCFTSRVPTHCVDLNLP